jgi:hypothetical protein
MTLSVAIVAHNPKEPFSGVKAVNLRIQASLMLQLILEALSG